MSLKTKDKKINILYIFSFRSTLLSWRNSGFHDREIKFFQKVSKNSNVTFYLLTYGSKEDLKIFDDANIKVLPMFKKSKNRYKILYLIWSIIYPFVHRNKLKNIDIIKANQLSGSWVGIILKFILNKPLIIRTGYDAYLFSMHESKPKYKQQLFKLLTYIALKFSDLYSVTSNADKKFIIDNYKFNNSKLILRPNWIDTSYKFTEAGYRNRKNKLISVGRLESQKNYMFLLDSLKGTDVEIDIIGSGRLKNNLIKFAKQNSIKLNIFENVSNTELLNILKNYKFFILPSIYEGNPKSLLEAMSCGCLVFASNIENNSEIIEDSYNGFLFDFEKDNLQHLLTDKINNSNKYEEVVKNSIKKLSTSNSLETLVQLEIKDYLFLSN
mgnify:CR=1 FL=1